MAPRDLKSWGRALAGPLLAALAAAAVILLTPHSGARSSVSVISWPTPPPQPPPIDGAVFGANVNWLFNTSYYTPAEVNAQLAELSATGATLARSDALWEASEPTRPDRGDHYDWRFDDRIAGALALHGLQWLPIVDYSPPWARSIPGQDHSPPTSDTAYAKYAAALAERYGPGGSFWVGHPNLPAIPVSTFEIWNEPDNAGFWAPRPDPSRYIELYLRARDAVARVDPTARVIIGGLTKPAGFLAAMLAARPDARGQIEGVGIHPYGATPAAIVASVNADHAAMSLLGLAGVPLYITEFGWTTRPVGALHYAAEKRRPGYIEQTLSTLVHRDCGVATVILYTWTTPQRNPTDPEQWFGIEPPNSGDRLSPDALGFLRGLEPAQTVPGCGS